jgi:hypothetical protein
MLTCTRTTSTALEHFECDVENISISNLQNYSLDVHISSACTHFKQFTVQTSPLITLYDSTKFTIFTTFQQQTGSTPHMHLFLL